MRPLKNQVGAKMDFDVSLEVAGKGGREVLVSNYVLRQALERANFICGVDA